MYPVIWLDTVYIGSSLDSTFYQRDTDFDLTIILDSDSFTNLKAEYADVPDD